MRPNTRSGLAAGPRNTPMILTAAAAVAILLVLGVAPAPSGGPAGAIRPAPEFPTSDPSHWINSPPLGMKDLRGKAVILEIWTFG